MTKWTKLFKTSLKLAALDMLVATLYSMLSSVVLNREKTNFSSGSFFTDLGYLFAIITIKCFIIGVTPSAIKLINKIKNISLTSAAVLWCLASSLISVAIPLLSSSNWHVVELALVVGLFNTYITKTSDILSDSWASSNDKDEDSVENPFADTDLIGDIFSDNLIIESFLMMVCMSMPAADASQVAAKSLLMLAGSMFVAHVGKVCKTYTLGIVTVLCSTSISYWYIAVISFYLYVLRDYIFNGLDYMLNPVFTSTPVTLKLKNVLPAGSYALGLFIPSVLTCIFQYLFLENIDISVLVLLRVSLIYLMVWTAQELMGTLRYAENKYADIYNIGSYRSIASKHVFISLLILFSVYLSIDLFTYSASKVTQWAMLAINGSCISIFFGIADSMQGFIKRMDIGTSGKDIQTAEAAMDSIDTLGNSHKMTMKMLAGITMIGYVPGKTMVGMFTSGHAFSGKVLSLVLLMVILTIIFSVNRLKSKKTFDPLFNVTLATPVLITISLIAFRNFEMLPNGWYVSIGLFVLLFGVITGAFADINKKEFRASAKLLPKEAKENKYFTDHKLANEDFDAQGDFYKDYLFAFLMTFGFMDIMYS